MTFKFMDRVRAAFAIWLPGGIAAAIVALTLVSYWGRDWLASAVVSAIAAALAIGLFELVVRQRRLEHLERELRALPRTPDATTVDTAGPHLSVLLRARLEHQPLPASTDGMVPFLTGLLVMLGLLGTMLGLFQTLNGAGNALTSSADLDALRRGLSAPIAGLTRSFGCAAAGISASAMLGLASALLRRREARAFRAVSAYALGPLREFSVSARQLRAIESLATRDRALPTAADAMERVGEKLGELAGQLISIQDKALEAQRQGMREVLVDVRRELSKAAAESGSALHARVLPMVEEDSSRRRAETAEVLSAMRRQFDEAEATRAAAHAKELAALTSLHAQSLGDVARREQALGDHWQELIERFDQQLTAAGTSEAERLRSLDAQVASAREREVEHSATLANSAAQVQAELERLSSALHAELEQRLTNEREQAEQLEQVIAQLSAAGSAVEQNMVQQGGAIEALVARVVAILPELISAAQAGAVDTLDRLRGLGEEQAQRLSQLEAALTRERHDHVRGLAEQLEKHAAGLEQRLTRTSGAVEEASAIWRASAVEMQAVAQLFAASVERQREAAEAWLESLGAIDRAVEQAGRDAAADALSEQLASTQELFARQLQFQRELMTQLRARRATPSQARAPSGGQDVPAGE